MAAATRWGMALSFNYPALADSPSIEVDSVSGVDYSGKIPADP
jgi:hypothetical protein